MRELNRARDDHSQRPRRNRFLLPYLILLVGLCFTAIVYYYFSKLTHEQDQSRFQKTVEELQDRIDDKIATSVALLRAGTGLFAASVEVDPDEFERFVQQFDLNTNYPGVQGIGFSLSFKPERKDALIKRLRSQGNSNFRVWPEGERNEYTAILYLQPNANRNDVAIGYDMYTEPARRQAMDAARDSGQPAASGRVHLVQEPENSAKQWGFLIYIPVYRNGAAINSVAERRHALLGWVYSPYRIDDFLQSVTSAKSYDVAFQVYDGTEVKSDKLLHGAADNPSRADSSFTQVHQLDVAGRTWTVSYAVKPSFERGSSRPLLKYTMIIGVLLSFLFFSVTRAEVRARSRAEQ